MIVSMSPPPSSPYPTTLLTMDVGPFSVNNNTWYTLLSVTGKGRLYRVSVIHTSLSNQYANIRITIDGNTPIVMTGGGKNCRGIAGGSYYGRDLHYDYFATLDFESSIKIEYMFTASGLYAYASADLALF